MIRKELQVTEAAELLSELAVNSYLLADYFRKGKPGKAFFELSEEKKEILKQLKSDDINNIRWPPWR